MDTYEIIPTSAQSADCQPIELWVTEERRLVFRPTLVENPNDPDACINGVFTYQRKRKKDTWEDHNEVPLQTLRGGEWVRIQLKAREVHLLIRHLAALYRFHGSQGLPRRKIHLLKLDLDDAESADIEKLDVKRLIKLSRRAGVDVLGQVLDWVAEQEDISTAAEHLRDLGPQASQRLSLIAGVSTVRKVLDRWKLNRTNASEEFWQKEFERFSFVLSQAFTFPLVVIKGKAYLGGKRLDNRGGHLADFLAANPATRNPVLVEIKTPRTPLLESSEYRDGIFAPSEEFAGGVSQVLNYQWNLLAHHRELTHGFEDRVQVFAPRCMLLVGDTAQLETEAQAHSFELARAGYRDVAIVTYDELFGKLEALLDALGGRGGESDGA